MILTGEASAHPRCRVTVSHTHRTAADSSVQSNTVLIAGGVGFLDSYLCSAFLANGNHVVVPTTSDTVDGRILRACERLTPDSTSLADDG